VGAIRNAELVGEIYPGWTALYYVDESVSDDVLRALGERGAEIIKTATESRGPMYGRFWRL
jgi:hypothetical protein